ncbi:hypothetical protein B0H14DRAFT_1182888 [Mycena olivaceomarginata]|nr:hypothetical protein B0H14DRAFT_1182888 [Mycena olivaceomarginata]
MSFFPAKLVPQAAWWFLFVFLAPCLHRGLYNSFISFTAAMHWAAAGPQWHSRDGPRPMLRHPCCRCFRICMPLSDVARKQRSRGGMLLP